MYISTLTSFAKAVPLLIFLLLAACGNNEQIINEPPPATVSVSKPLKLMLTEWDEYTGRFQAVDRVEIRARVSGYLKETRFEDGAMVKRGDVLFVIDQRPFKIALQQTRAELKQAQSEIKQAQNDFNRAQKLRKSRAISEEDFDQRQQSLMGAQARVEAMRAAVDNARLNLEFTEVKAPISGRVGRDLVNPGNLINGGSANATLLTTLISLDPIHFYFEGSESDLLKYIRLSRSGQRPASRNSPNPVLVKLQDEKEFVHQGVMNFVDNELDLGTGTILGRAVFPNKDGILQPGLFGRARLIGRSRYEALLIPDDAINSDQSKKYVYVVNEQNRAGRAYIELGPLHDNGLRIIRSGLDEDARVVIGGIQRIRMPDQVVAPAAGTIQPMTDIQG